MLPENKRSDGESQLQRLKKFFLVITDAAKNAMFPSAPPHPSLVKKDPALLESIDDRISFDLQNAQYIYEEAEKEYQYNFILQEWIPVGGNLAGNEVNDELDNVDNIRRLKKQKLEELKQQPADKPASKVNTGVFVSNLPEGTTADAIEQAFGKYGLISEDFKTGNKRIKLYNNEDGVFKGEALVIYYNKESVDLAVQMLDDTVLKAGTKRMKVEPARFDPSEKKRLALSAEEKQLIQNKTLAMKKKLSDWGDSHLTAVSSSKADLIKRKIWDKTIVIENMFRKQELQENPVLEVEIKQDIQDECDILGIGKDITKIVVDGDAVVVSVKFGNPELSEKCIAGFSGRYFDGLKLQVKKYAGGGNNNHNSNEGEKESDAERMERFGDWLEQKVSANV